MFRVNFFRAAVFYTVFFLTCFSEAAAQKKDFGDVTPEDFFAYDLSYDSTASAVVLFDAGGSYFDSDYNCFLVRHVRLKILNAKGLEYANVNVRFDEEYDQYVRDVEAATYVLKNGQVIKHELGRREVHEEKIYDDVHEVKFTMPAVTEGAIIEYQYKKKYGSPWFLPDWVFHKEIPVEFSSIRMEIPANFYYKMIYKGIDTLFTHKTENSIWTRGRANTITITKDNIPPVEDLPFVNTRDDFISEIYTQLEIVQYPGTPRRTFFRDWDDVADEIRRHDGIGRQRADGAIKDAVAGVINEGDSAFGKMKDIYSFVTKSMVWNRRQGVVTEKGIRDAFEEKSGNAADINLLLYEMLDVAGLNVSWGLISTKEHGQLIPNFPIVNQFNHIVAVVQIDGYAYLLDATEGARSYALPPVKDLYRTVFVITNDSYGWLDSQPLQASSEKLSLNYSLQKNGLFKAELDGRLSGYYGQDFREDAAGLSGEEVIKSIIGEVDSLKVDTVSIQNLEDIDSEVKISAGYSFKEPGTSSPGEFIYLDPWFFLKSAANPFKRKTREFPVYFSYPYREQYIVNIEIPEGYSVDELPENAMYRITPAAGSFRFMVNNLGDRISLLSDFSIDQVVFRPEDYQTLRGLFEQVVESHAKPIVLKKVQEENPKQE